MRALNPSAPFTTFLPSTLSRGSKTQSLLCLSKSKSKSTVHFDFLASSSAAPFKSLAPLRYSVPACSSEDLSSPVHDSSAASVVSSSGKSLKNRLRDGETLYGLFLLSFSPTLAEIAGLAGYDFVLVDMEHGPGGITEALHCMRALAATRTPAILRLPETSPVWAKKALDLGPQGIMFPMIDSPKLAKKAVSYCRFPPAGIRGSAHTPPAGTRGAAHPVIRASKYGLDGDYVVNSERDLFIMCQVESAEAVKKVGVISAVDGVDCVMMGPLDLSADMGYLTDPAHPKVKEMMADAEEAVLGRIRSRGSGAYLGGFAVGNDDGLGPAEMRSRGYHMVCGAVDVGLFRDGVVRDVNKFKEAHKMSQ
ncbi:unnamed protein product [Linum tenue]|uniref:HpcH/HpaI aldolase/citrate lyase domain-containing protein n=2 Tax=Linum tenue TaxID=586396 RepID=A0AAV0JGF8_9ROSI|nr:unnamed protein product [Linum tenue]